MIVSCEHLETRLFGCNKESASLVIAMAFKQVFFVLVRNLEKQNICVLSQHPKTYLFEQVSNPTSKVMPIMGNELGGFRTVGQRVFTLCCFLFSVWMLRCFRKESGKDSDLQLECLCPGLETLCVHTISFCARSDFVSRTTTLWVDRVWPP